MRRSLHYPISAIEPMEQRMLLAAALTPVGTQPAGALSGRIIFTSGGHGFTAANTSGGGWSTQRGLTNGMVEDFGNQDQMTAYVNYLFNAGATIVPMRPVGYQPNEVVLDNDSPGVTFSGTWSNSTGTVFYGTAGDVPYKFASTSATETAVAKYTPNIPVAGFYPVYGWAADGSNRATDQLYRITHGGGSTEVRVNHRRVGKGWVYLGTYYFDQGTGGFVEISNKSASSGSVVIADAIRFGNGMGDIDRGGGISGHSREDEAALYWIMKMAGVGTPSSVYASLAADIDSNVGAPPKYAAYMNNQAEGMASDRLFLSFHSNADSGTARGVLGLYNSPAAATVHQQAWAQLVGQEINDDMVAIGSPPLETSWFGHSPVTLDRSDIDFGEIRSDSINNEMDATIAEVAYHDNASDAELLRDPKVRNWIARAAYQASVKYFNQFGSLASVDLLPEAPGGIRTAVDAGGNVTVSWSAPVVDGIGGQAPSGYRLYASRNGYGFDGGISVAGGSTLSYTIPAAQLDNGIYYFRIAAVNAGGESLPSEVAAARKPATARPKVLIVNGFDRLQRTQDPKQNTALSPGGTVVSVDRVRPRYSNSFDYVVQVASAMIGAGADVEINSASNEMVGSGAVNLGDYSAVIWISGEESAGDQTFDATERTLVKNYLDGGGKMLVSGSEIGWDMVAQNNAPTFYNQTFKANYVADDANTYNASGAANSIFAGISLSFDNGAQFYDVDFPDVISASGGSTLAMNYSTGGGAAIQFSSGNQRLVMLGFPFETITTVAARTSVMGAVMGFFQLIAATTGKPDLAAGSDHGISTSDDITNLDNSAPGKALQFMISGTTAGASVKLFADGVLIGSAVAGGTSTTINSSGSFDLSDGAHAITVTQAFGVVESTPSAGLQITIDTAAPTVDVVDVSPDPRTSSLSSAGINFNETVANFDLADLVLSRNGVARILNGVAGLNSSDNRNFVLSNLSGLTTSSGKYLLQVNSGGSGIIDVAGNALGAGASDQWFTTTQWIEGTDAADHYTVRFIAASNTIEVTEQTVGTPDAIYSYSRATTPLLNIQMLGGDDAIDIDLGGTDLIVELDGDAGSDALAVNSGTLSLRPAIGGPILLEDLSVNPGAMLDIGSEAMVLQPTADQLNSLYSSLIPLLRAGRNGGGWDGPGISSSIAAADSSHVMGVGLLLTASQIRLGFARVGDLDLDGDIDPDDFARIDAGFINGSVGYQNGDIDYSGGRPDADDYFLIDRSFGLQSSPPMAAVSSQSVRKPTAKVHHRKPRRRLAHTSTCFHMPHAPSLPDVRLVRISNWIAWPLPVGKTCSKTHVSGAWR